MSNDKIISLIQGMKSDSKRKFDQTVDISINVDMPKSASVVRGFVDLPHKHGKSVNVLVFSESGVKNAGEHDVVQDPSSIEGLQGKISKIDVSVSDNASIKKIGKAAKVLGPKGLMPNIKSGTVEQNAQVAFDAFKFSRVSFFSEKNGIVHCGIAKLSMSDNEISENIVSFYKAVQSMLPEKAHVKSVYVSPTMGKSYKLDEFLGCVNE